MAITSDNMAQITARVNVGRAATMRAGVALRITHLEDDGRLVFQRDIDSDGDPISTALTWTNGRE
jgi:hypothetical protein